MAKTYGGHTLKELEELVAASETTEESFDTVAGGDSAAGCAVIKDLVAALRKANAKIRSLDRNLNGD